MSFFESLKPMIQLNQYTGLAPISFENGAKKWQTNRVLYIFSILSTTLLALIVTCHIVFNKSFINHSDGKIGVYLYVLMFALVCIHAFVLLSEVFLKRNKQIVLLESFMKLEKMLKQEAFVHLDYVHVKRSCYRNFIIFFVQLIILFIAILCLYIITKSTRGFYYLLSFIPPYFVCSLSYSQLMTYVSLLAQCVETINKYLDSMIKESGFHVREAFVDKRNAKSSKWKRAISLNASNKQSTLNFVFLRRVYCLIWESSILINDLMYWSMPLGFANLFYVLVFNAYWFFLAIFSNKVEHKFVTLLFSSLYLSINVLTILTITGTCNYTVEKVNLISWKSKVLHVRTFSS